MPELQTQKGFLSASLLKSFFTFSLSVRFSLLLAIVSFVFLYCYVFVFSPYENFLYNDMLDFWRRALDRLEGDTFVESQFLAWPPWYHIFIAETLRAFKVLGLVFLIRFETFIVINLLMFAVSVFAFHRVAIRWFKGDACFSLAAALLYAFGFPAWFFNAFLLADNLAAPLVVCAVALFYLKSGFRYLILSAVLFAFASIIRPSVAPYGLAFVIALLVTYRFNFKFILRAGIFSAVFFSLVFLAMSEVSRISKGKVSGLSANGGLDFFIANSRIYRIDLNYDGWHNFIVVPAYSWKPDQGFFKSQVPYYYQDYYYKLGWQYITHNPKRLIENIEHVQNLFFASMLPSRTDAPGFTIFRPVWDVLKFICFLATFYFIWLWRDLSDEEKQFFSFMLSVIVITCLVSYIYTGEPRYTYSIIFIFYLIGLKVLHFAFINRARLKYASPRVLGLLVGLWIGGKALAFAITPSYENHIKAQFSGQSNKNAGQVFNLERITFPHQKKKVLSSADENMQLYSAGELTLQTVINLEGPARDTKWDVQSSWPIRMKIDGETFFAIENVDYFRETPIFYNLKPGKHLLEVTVRYTAREGGLSLVYSYKDEENWIYRQMVGEDHGPITFSLPGEK